eukprot:CAMPEP_0117594662 /NCGR_PEP_ID=MMETSP0784-20121206/73328_1 /TAXON_ID=39447 /ORGANISM="" /LENGTH=442 /DNA_ID=CAMNT_0005396751 /DNA_START=3 /DNA_END=1332 /DNA_ORIENTATION=+
MERPRKRARVATAAADVDSAGRAAESPVSVGQLFAGAASDGDRADGGLSSAFSRLFPSFGGAGSAAGIGVSAVLTDTSAARRAIAAEGKGTSVGGAAAASRAAAKAAVAAAAKLLKKRDDSGKDEKKTLPEKGFREGAAVKQDKAVAKVGKVGKAGKAPKLTAAQREERDSKTLFVGNVPLGWNKKRLRTALREAVGEKYRGSLKTIWFRSEPIDENYSGSMRKVGSIKGAYAKNAADAKNAYILLDSPEDVLTVRNEAQGLKADKDHFLRLDGVGEAAQLVQFDRKRSVFVGNLPADASEADLRVVFTRLGVVDAVRIVRDRYTNACKGFAFVRFKERASVKKAVELWGTEVRGRPIRVMKVESQESDVDQKNLDPSHPAARRIQQRMEKRFRHRMRKAANPSQSAKKTKGAKTKDKKTMVNGRKTSGMAKKAGAGKKRKA